MPLSTLLIPGLEGEVDPQDRLLLFDEADTPLLTHPRLKWQLGVASLPKWRYNGRPPTQLIVRARWKGFIVYPHHIVLAAQKGLSPQILTALDGDSPEELVSLLQAFKPSRFAPRNGKKLDVRRSNVDLPPRYTPQAVAEEATPQPPTTPAPPPLADLTTPDVWKQLGLGD